MQRAQGKQLPGRVFGAARGEQKGLEVHPRVRCVWGDTPPRLCMLLLSPHCAPPGSACREPIGKTQQPPKQLALCKRSSLLLERRVPARPSPAGASQINAWLGFSM